MRTAPGGAGSPTRRPGFAALVVTLLFAIAGAASAGAASAGPRVVVTVKPLHSLVAGVMAGIGEPDVIIRGGGSPHSYSLKPSEARLLESAQVIFWIGAPLETFLEKPLAALGSRARVVPLLQAPGIRLLSGRTGGDWAEHDGHDPAGHTPDAHGAASGAAGDRERIDGHIWLDPANARIIAREAAQVLGQVDPGNRGRYAANAERLVDRIDALDADVKATLAPVRDVPYVVFHDAYQYFESRYGLHAVGSVTVSAERKPGARRVKEIRDAIGRLGARCVFSEPQFSPAILGTLLEGTSIRTGALDPLGAGLPTGPDAYFALMSALATSLAECLARR